MSKTIDQRVVEMRFDNSDFEKNVSTSMHTLDQLKSSLDLSDAAKGLQNLGNASGAISEISGIGSAVETVKDKFSALEMIGVGALMKIGAQAVELGEKMVNELVLDQITAGWSKYADKTTSVQTIMAATAKDFADQGEQMEYVSEQLDKLNWFTDETSYNFVDMTNNIGKFTSQGIKLDEAVTAMEGISVWAAQSGQNAEAASRAMYNLSQALGVGAVKLQDWKSIENANMATKEFKEMAIAAGEAMGTIKKGQVTVANFSQSLGDKDTKGWFSSDVLMNVLAQYGTFTDELNKACNELDLTATELLGDLEDYQNGTLDTTKRAKELNVSAEELTATLDKLGSSEFDLGRKSFKSAQEAKTFAEAIDATKDAVSTSWLNIFETIFGNYLEAKALWTDLAEFLYNVFAEPVNNLGELMDDWAEAGGRDNLIEAFSNIGETITNVIDTIKEAWKEIFPPKTGQDLANFTEKFKNLTERIKEASENNETFKSIVRGIASSLKLVIIVLKTVFNILKPLFALLKNGMVITLNFIAAFSDFISGVAKGIPTIKDTTNALEPLDNVLERLKISLKIVRNAFNRAFYTEDNKLLGFVSGAIEGFRTLSNEMINFVENASGVNLSGFQSKFNKAINNIKDHMGSFFDTLINYYNEAGGGFKGAFIAIQKVVSEAIDTIAKKIQELTGLDFSKKVSGIGDKFTEVKENVKKFFDKFKDADKANDKLTKTQETLEILSGIFKALGEAIKKVITGIGDTISSSPLMTLFAIFSLKNFASINELIKTISDTIKSFLKSIESVKDIGNNISLVIKSVNDSLSAFQKSIKLGSILAIAAAIALLAYSLTVLSNVPTDEIAITLGVLTAAIGELVGSLAIINTFKSNKGGLLGKIFGGSDVGKMAVSMIAISAAILIFSHALKQMNEAIGGDWNTFATCIGGAAAALLILIGALKLLSVVVKDFDTKTIIQMDNAASIIIVLAAAAKLLAEAMKTASEIGGWKEIIASAGAVAIGLIALGAAAKICGKEVNSKAALTILALALAVKMLADSLLKIGDKATYDQINTGLLMLCGILTELVLACNFLQVSIGGSVVATILALAIAVKMLANTVFALGTADTTQMFNGLLALGSILTILVVACNAFNGIALQTGVGLVLVAAGIYIITQAINSLKDADLEGIINALIGIGGALGLIVIATNSMESSIAGAAGILLCAVAIGILAQAISTLTQYGLDELIPGLMALASAILLVVVASQAMQEALPGAAAMLVAAAAIGILALAVAKVAEIPLENAIEGIVALAAALLIFAVAAVALTSSGAALAMVALSAAIAACLALVGLGMLTIAGAFMLFAESLSILSITGGAAGEALTLFGTALKNNIGIFLEFSSMLILFSAELQAFGIAATIASVGATLLAAGILVLSIAITALVGASVLMAAFSSSLEITGEALKSFTETIKGVAPGCVTAAAKLAILYEALLAMSVISPILDVAIIALAGSLGVLDLAFATFSDSVIKCGDGLDKTAQAIEKMKENGPGAATSIAAFAAGFAAVVPSLKSSANKLQPFAKTLTEITNATNSLNGTLITINATIMSINATLIMMTQSLTTMNTSLLTVSTTINEPFTASLEAIVVLFNNLPAKISTSANNIVLCIRNMGTRITEGLRSSMSSDTASTIGKNFVQGLTNGIKAKQSEAVAAANSVGTAVKNSIQKTLQVHSPSKFGIWIGENVDYGLAKGLNGSVGEVTDASESVASEAITSMSNTLSKIQDALNTDFDLNPVITPVLDMTDVRNEAGKINSLFNYDSAVTASYGLTNRSVTSDAQALQQQALLKQLTDKINESIINSNQNQNTPVDVNVVLQGDAGGIFKVVKAENQRYIKSTGRSPLGAY